MSTALSAIGGAIPSPPTPPTRTPVPGRSHRFKAAPHHEPPPTLKRALRETGTGPVRSRRRSVGIPGLYIPEMTHRAAPELDHISLTHKRKIQNAGRKHEHIVVRAFPTRLLGMLPQFLQRSPIYAIECVEGCSLKPWIFCKHLLTALFRTNG